MENLDDMIKIIKKFLMSEISPNDIYDEIYPYIMHLPFEKRLYFIQCIKKNLIPNMIIDETLKIFSMDSIKRFNKMDLFDIYMELMQKGKFYRYLNEILLPELRENINKIELKTFTNKYIYWDLIEKYLDILYILNFSIENDILYTIIYNQFSKYYNKTYESPSIPVSISDSVKKFVNIIEYNVLKDLIFKKSPKKTFLLEQLKQIYKSKFIRNQLKSSQSQSYFVPFYFRQLQLENYIYDPLFYDIIQSDFILDNIDHLEYLSQNVSSSLSNIYKGIFEGRNVFIKEFKADNKVLIYEKEIYRYIRYFQKKDSEIEKYFINLLICVFDNQRHTSYIISQDVRGQSLEKMKKILSKETQQKIWLQVLYILYLLKTKLQIVHFDLHSGNIIVYNDNEPIKEFKIDDVTFRINDHPYSIKVYDFDNASCVDSKIMPLNPKIINKKLQSALYDYDSDLYQWIVQQFIIFFSIRDNNLPSNFYSYIQSIPGLWRRIRNVLSNRGKKWHLFCENPFNFSFNNCQTVINIDRTKFNICAIAKEYFKKYIKE